MSRRTGSGHHFSPSQETTGKMRSTLTGGVAVLLWSLLALLTTWVENIPVFQLLTLSFTIAFIAGALYLRLKRREKPVRISKNLSAWLISVGGLFGYHLFYFIALRNAPAVEASLIAYLWPMLIVVFSTFLPGERLRWFHVVGVLLGFSGAFLIISKGQHLFLSVQYIPGYLAALVCALIWSAYSVLNRQFDDVSTETVTGYCGVIAVLSLIFHLYSESWITPDFQQAFTILALGLGPIGLAFFAWDFGTKHGNIQILAAFSYAAPLLSTLLLVVYGKAEFSWVILVSAVLIVAGAIITAANYFPDKLPIKKPR